MVTELTDAVFTFSNLAGATGAGLTFGSVYVFAKLLSARASEDRDEAQTDRDYWRNEHDRQRQQGADAIQRLERKVDALTQEVHNLREVYARERNAWAWERQQLRSMVRDLGGDPAEVVPLSWPQRFGQDEGGQDEAQT